MSEALIGRRATRVDGFFGQLTGTFDQAAARELCTERIELGSHPIDLRFAGDSMKELVMPALRHLLSTTDEAPAFTIDVFDTVSTGVQVGPPPWGPHDYLARGEIRGFNFDPYRTSYRVDSGVLTMANLDVRRGVLWMRDPAYYPGWMQAAPLRNLLSWWAAWNGLQFVHGAAVGVDDCAVLLSAPGGSGKSTTAVRAALGGMQFLGDDYVIVDPDGPQVHSIYSSAKLDHRALETFAPGLARYSRGLIGEVGHEKHHFLGTDIFPRAVVASRRLVALVVPTLGGTRTEVVRMSGGAALTAVAPTSLFQLEGSSAEDFSALAAIIRSLPIVQLRIGSDDDVVAALTDFIRDVAP